MAVEILVRAVSSGDILKGNYFKGFPVVAIKTPWSWGSMESPSDFVIVRVEDAEDVSNVQKMVQEWKRKASYEILDFNPTNDFFHVHIFADQIISTSNPVAQLTTVNMTEFLTKWGGKKITSTDTGVTFEITALEAIKNRGLFDFGSEEDFIKYTETNYDPTTGIHTVELDYTLTNLKIDNILNTLQTAELKIVNYDDASGKCTFNGVREKMIKQLESQVSQKFDTMIARTRYRFKDELIDQALILPNGRISITLDTLDDNIVDVSEEV